MILLYLQYQFCQPSLADGRDLLYHIIPKQAKNKTMQNVDEDDEDQPEESESTETEWKPSMNLYELIQYIPDFIAETL